MYKSTLVLNISEKLGLTFKSEGQNKYNLYLSFLNSSEEPVILPTVGPKILVEMRDYVFMI